MQRMSEISPATEQASASSKRLPGDLAIWFFIMAELVAFAVFFSAYAFTRAKHVEMFNLYQQTLDRDLGALNTVLLKKNKRVDGSPFDNSNKKSNLKLL